MTKYEVFATDKDGSHKVGTAETAEEVPVLLAGGRCLRPTAVFVIVPIDGEEE